MQISRRDFLKVFGASAAVLGVGARIAPPGLAPLSRSVPELSPDQMGMLMDTTKCIGCKRCVVACQTSHDLPVNADVTSLSPHALSFVDVRNISPDPNKPVIKTVKRQCMHCQEPGCVSACTVGALQKLPSGPVVYDSAKCIGCRYCMYACPYGVPTFEWSKQLSLMVKCDGCINLVKNGQPTACSAACPVGAIKYGKRSELLTIAHQRIDDPQANYIKHVYGETEAGGSSRIYLSAVPFEQLGFPQLPDASAAEASEKIMHATPIIAGAMATVLTTLYFITKRFADRQPEAAEQTHAGEE